MLLAEFTAILVLAGALARLDGASRHRARHGEVVVYIRMSGTAVPASTKPRKTEEGGKLRTADTVEAAKADERNY